MRLFDVLGPVMIGPSSSHTAGAAKIGYTAQKLLGEVPRPKKSGDAVRFEHVSLTYAGAGAPSLSDISFTAKRGQTLVSSAVPAAANPALST